MENELQEIDLNLKHLQLDPSDPAYGYRQQTMYFANLALDHFNKENHTKYVLIEDEDMLSNPIGYGAWFHCSFKAKEDSSVEHFFGEIDRITGGVSDTEVVTTCQILKDEKLPGCEFCLSLIIHPVDGYKLCHCEDSSSEQFFGEDEVNGPESAVTNCQVLDDEKHDYPINQSDYGDPRAPSPATSSMNYPVNWKDFGDPRVPSPYSPCMNYPVDRCGFGEQYALSQYNPC